MDYEEREDQRDWRSARGSSSSRSRGTREPGSWRSRAGGQGGGRGGGRGGGPGAWRGGPGDSNICYNFLRKGDCAFGENCKYSHETGARARRGGGQRDQRAKPQETQEQLRAKTTYNSWKKLICQPPQKSGTADILPLWTGALEILDDEDWDLKQRLPRDLNEEELYGKQHIRKVMNMEVIGRAHSKFVELAAPFMSTITHTALLDCSSVDSFVGSLYSFVGGAQGSRAIPFFQLLITSLFQSFPNSGQSEIDLALGRNIATLLRALDELLEREHKIAFNEDLPGLLDSIERVVVDTKVQSHMISHHGIDSIQSVRRLRGIVKRRTGMLQTDKSDDGDVVTTVVSSTFPRSIIMPSNRHDNDKLDITEIKILPTEDEIRSNHPEFLPSTDFQQPHFISDPSQRHLDTHFRLLRHDIFGDLKRALGGLMFGAENDATVLDQAHHNFGDVQANSYSKAWISYISFESKRGLEASVSFAQPRSMRKKSSTERARWWQESRRLEPGILLCFLYLRDGKSSVLLLTVADKNVNSKGEYDLSSNEHQATIKAKFAAKDQRSDLESLIELSYQRTQGVLLEFPGVMLATFIPILENLQRMQRQSQLRFSQWILPNPSSDSLEPVEIPPAIYSRTPGFRFPLAAISRNPATSELSIDSQSRPDDPVLIDKLCSETELDRGQCEALVAALVREYALIQGPPGTGKSFVGVAIMRALLAIREKANLGPIIVVCYTNHALDQFLEHLMKVGIEKIIRIGSQSKSEMLEGKNLRVVAKEETTTKSEGYNKYQCYELLDGVQTQFRGNLGKLHGTRKELPAWGVFKTHLMTNHPEIYRQFLEVDEDGFETVGVPFDNWMRNVEKSTSVPVSADSSQLTTDQILFKAKQGIYTLTAVQKRCLVNYWIGEVREHTTDRLFDLAGQAGGLHQQLNNVHEDVNRRVLTTADVIGVTTTGLAKNIATLCRVKSKVVICEEAGEVLEAHMLSALMPSVEHCIQIGDHLQLRPKVNNFKLSLESTQGALHKLDRSQFERLVIDQSGRRTSFPVAQLNVQRRMRPGISTFPRETLYRGLVDHENVKQAPDVIGMRDNVLFLDHKNAEEGPNQDMHQKSHSNLWEVSMTHALVRHIVRQGAYTSQDIAVITPYTGQLQKLRAKMRKEFEIVLSDRDQDELALGGFQTEDLDLENEMEETGAPGKRSIQKKQISDMLRLATVDNFQGEEAKVIIISLVRSNRHNKVGFLRTSNRINVLLTRAKHGMYLIGDAEMYSTVPMWSKVIGMMRAEGSVRNSFSLCCPRHPETEIVVSSPEDFEILSPEGGCQLTCDRRLSCGHRCKAKCHSDSMHLAFSCPQPCERTHKPCNHSCKKATCGEDCGLCRQKLDNIKLPCGHVKDGVQCFETQNLAKIACSVIVEKQVSGCNHFVNVPCTTDVSTGRFKCPTPCGAVLKCGDRCPGTCGECNNVEAGIQDHKTCTKVCGRPFGTCNHTCSRKCHDGDDCGVCFSPCQVRCSHSKCQKLCREPCAPCIEQCTWSCEHKGACPMPCGAPCTRLPCNQRCEKTLSCGHQCPGVCGEECPQGFCQICSGKDDARVDLLEMRSYNEIDLNETPIVVLSCGHFFITESVDGLIGMNDVYVQDGSGEFTGLRDISGALATSAPRCPDCNTQIRQYATQRYNRVVNRFVIDEMSKRFLISGKDNLRILEKEIEELHHDFETTREDIIKTIPTATVTITRQVPATKTATIIGKLNKRYEKSTNLQKSILVFQQKSTDKHQPAQKLADATIYAARKRPLNQMMGDLELTDQVPKLAKDRRVTFGGKLAQLKAENYTLQDKFVIAKALKGMPPGGSISVPGGSLDKLTKLFFKTCHAFIESCNQEKLPKMAVEASIYYAHVARAYQSYCGSVTGGGHDSSDNVKIANQLLENAKEMCNQKFENAEALGTAVEESLRLLGKEWYDEVTAEELAAIKQAMVSGPSGIATHSGHWYNCVEGHPFAIGDCGMPMEEARCPECGSPVGGRNHQAVAGVTRATEMER